MADEENQNRGAGEQAGPPAQNVNVAHQPAAQRSLIQQWLDPTRRPEPVENQNGGTSPRTRPQQFSLPAWFLHPAPAGSPRQRGDFTSRAFLGLPYPMPVVDVLDSEYLKLMRGIFQVFFVRTRSLGLYLTASVIEPMVGLIFTLTGTFITSPPSTGWFIEQKILEWFFARRLLRANAPRLAWLWWSFYFVFANSHDFETNFVKAWSENAIPEENVQQTYVIYVDNEELLIPRLPGDNLDKTRLTHLDMFFRLLKFRRAVLDVILPRTLVRVDWVQVEDSQRVLGEQLETMDLGRRAGRFTKLALLEDGSRKLAVQEANLKTQYPHVTLGIEFVRRYDRNAITGVVLVPPLGSLVFALIWMAVFLSRSGQKDVQVIVTTAFSVASYLVTAGALVIALVAYLDTAVDDDERRPRRDSV